MPNIQTLLNDEIRRLARKEVITLEKDLKAQLVELRRTIAEQQRRIKMLEKIIFAASEFSPKNADFTEAAPEAEKAVRVTAERITKWRKSLGLNQTQYAKLLEVSPLSVSHWENGISSPREAQKRRIAALRDMGKRKLLQICQEKGIKLSSRNSETASGQ